MKKIFSIMMAAALMSMTFTGCIEEIDPQTSTVTEQQAKDAPGAFDNFVQNLTGNLSAGYRACRNQQLV